MGNLNVRPLYLLVQVHRIEHHDVVSSGIIADEIWDKHPREWKKQALISLEEAKEAYMLKVIANLDC